MKEELVFGKDLLGAGEGFVYFALLLNTMALVLQRNILPVLQMSTLRHWEVH